MFEAITRQVLETKKRQKQEQSNANNDTINIRRQHTKSKKKCC